MVDSLEGDSCSRTNEGRKREKAGRAEMYLPAFSAVAAIRRFIVYFSHPLMADIIVIAGSPGSGKHTIAALLRGRLGFPPHVDLGHIREFHLDREWTLANEQEEAMSFQTLEFMTRHYRKYGYKNIIVTDLQDFRVRQIPEVFAGLDVIIITLYLSDDGELKKRISARKEGFKNVEEALSWNSNVRQREGVKNEFKLDNTSKDPPKIVEKILKIIGR